MNAQAGSEGMRKAGIIKPTDLIEFPWEKTATDLPDEAEVSEMQKLMAEINNQ